MAKTIAATSTTTTFAWDTLGPVPEILSDGTTDYLPRPNGQVFEQIALSASTPSHLVENHLGSTRVITNASESVTGTYTFDGYGNVARHTGIRRAPPGTPEATRTPSRL